MTPIFLNADNITALRDSIVTRFNATTDYREKATLQRDADSLNTYIDANDFDVRTICFGCINCAAYANDRQNGHAFCDNGCGMVKYQMFVL